MSCSRKSIGVVSLTTICHVLLLLCLLHTGGAVVAIFVDSSSANSKLNDAGFFWPIHITALTNCVAISWIFVILRRNPIVRRWSVAVVFFLVCSILSLIFNWDEDQDHDWFQ